MDRTRRFLLFAGSFYYPSGGWEDLQGSFDSLESALVAGVVEDADGCGPVFDWWQVVDSQARRIVETGNRNER